MVVSFQIFFSYSDLVESSCFNSEQALIRTQEVVVFLYLFLYGYIQHEQTDRRPSPLPWAHLGLLFSSTGKPSQVLTLLWGSCLVLSTGFSDTWGQHNRFLCARVCARTHTRVERARKGTSTLRPHRKVINELFNFN